MDSGKNVLILLQSGDTPLPFRPEKYEVEPMDITGASFDSIADFIKEKGGNGILVDVPETATDAINICRQVKGNRDFEALPLVALLRLATRAIVTAVIEARVDEAVLLPTTESVIAERIDGMMPEHLGREMAMAENAPPPS
jgi:uncharacterized hydantoinase/oxoprolinase family protein